MQLPLLYPIVECFRLSMLAMSHPDFPFPVMGAVLARNTTHCSRPIQPGEGLLYRWVMPCCTILEERQGGPRRLANPKAQRGVIVGRPSTGLWTAYFQLGTAVSAQVSAC
jgi:hypothetical protein